MAAAELIDDHVSAKQCKLAVDALLKHEKQRSAKLEESSLLPGKEQHVWLQITVKQMHPEKKLKPHKIPLAHPIVDPRESPICLITKDPQREYKDLLEANNIRFISRVVGITKLKGKFKPFEARRMLLKENGLFLADERVVPLLPGLLGKKFFDAKKQPIPVCLTRKDLKGELERAISSTYFHQNQGTCSSIKIGTLAHSPAHVLANLKSALPAVAKTIKGSWDNIQSLHIKTSTSTSLPIWSCDLGAEEGGRWDRLVDREPSVVEDSAGEEEPEKVEEKKPTKGKKRAAAADEEQVEQPKKKAKAASGDAVAKSTKGADSKGKTASATVDAPAPSKKRKASAGKDVSPPPAGSASGPNVKAKADQVASDAPATPKAQDGKKKSKGKASQPELAPAPSTSTSAADAEPEVSAPSASKQKPRAVATDFFDDGEAPSEGVAPPPNTPADGLKASGRTTRSTAQKKGTKGAKAAKDALQTPVSGAISKLEETVAPAEADPVPTTVAEEPAAPSAPTVEKPARKTRKKASASAEPAADDDATSAGNKDAGEKRVLRKRKGAEKAPEVAAPVAEAGSVSVEEVKQKLGASGVEKKKAKAVKSKGSAKDALIGKKGL